MNERLFQGMVNSFIVGCKS